MPEPPPPPPLDCDQLAAARASAQSQVDNYQTVLGQLTQTSLLQIAALYGADPGAPVPMNLLTIPLRIAVVGPVSPLGVQYGILEATLSTISVTQGQVWYFQQSVLSYTAQMKAQGCAGA